MAKTLVIAEKPSVGRDIARVLHCNKSNNGVLEGNQYVVTWALGHLVTLADPEKYDVKYQSWRSEDLPIIPEKMNLVVIGKTAKQYNVVKKQLLRNDIKDVVIATDAGREGELVARWIIQKAKAKKPLKRLWISSVTDKAIKEGFKHLKDAKQYESLYWSAYSRSVADWIVGINATRALTCKYNAQLACGRVQTPTLAIINHREQIIKNFKPVPFYGIKANTGDVIWSWYHGNEKHSFNKANVEKVLNNLSNELIITDVQTKDKKTMPSQLYDLTSLQQDANRLYGFSAKETLSIMQNLYEYHKVLTYPRTDSRYLTDDIVPTIKERLIAIKGGDFDIVINKILQSPIKKQNHFVNNSKVSDHHAIIPTEESAYIGSFSDGEKKIYNLVVKRFLSVLLPPYEYLQTNISAKAGTETFKVVGKVEKNLGWKEVYSNKELDLDDDINTLPLFKNGQKLTIDKIELTENNTTPPAYFNEATLLAAMENPVKHMNTTSKELSKTLVETGGLGTVATRADIIEKLLNTFLVEKRGQALHVTAKGRQLLELVPNDLKYPELTAKWETQLSMIAKGKQNYNSFISEIKEYTNTLLSEIESKDAKYKHDNITTKKCPECNNFMLEVNGKKGKMLICSSRECKHRETLSIVTNARCPQCHKKLELVGSGDKQMFVCKNCGHRQHMNSFKKERENKKDSANKNDVRNYMKKQQKQEVTVEDSPFAALLNLKKDL